MLRPFCDTHRVAPVVLRLSSFTSHVGRVTRVKLRPSSCVSRVALIMLHSPCCARNVASVMLHLTRCDSHVVPVALRPPCRVSHVVSAMLRPHCCIRWVAFIMLHSSRCPRNVFFLSCGTCHVARVLCVCHVALVALRPSGRARHAQPVMLQAQCCNRRVGPVLTTAREIRANSKI